MAPFLLTGVLLATVTASARVHRRPTRYHCEATAFSVEGVTKAGTGTHYGTVAADPRVFPLGTVIRVRDAGPYSGTYQVTDTGAKVQGRHVDLYLPNASEAKRFGKKMVWVQVVKWGDWAPKEARARLPR